jgi:hypothetical protein
LLENKFGLHIDISKKTMNLILLLANLGSAIVKWGSFKPQFRLQGAK